MRQNLTELDGNNTSQDIALYNLTKLPSKDNSPIDQIYTLLN